MQIAGGPADAAAFELFCHRYDAGSRGMRPTCSGSTRAHWPSRRAGCTRARGSPPAHRVRKGLLGRLVLPGLRARRAIPDPRRPCVSSPVRTPFAVGTTKPWFRWCVLTARPTGPNVPPQATRPRAYVCASDWRPHSIQTPRAVSSAKLCRSFYRRSATHCAKAIALGCGVVPLTGTANACIEG